MMTLGEIALLTAAAASGAVPYARERLSAPSQDVLFSASRRTALGMSDYLPYEELIEPDTILTTYGGLGAMFAVDWADTSSMSDREFMQHCSLLNDAQMRVARATVEQTGWMMQPYCVPVPAEPLAMPEHIPTDTRRVLAEAHNGFMAGKRKVMQSFLAFAYRPSPTSSRKSSLFMDGVSAVESSYDKIKDEYDKVMHSVTGALQGTGTLRRLGTHPKYSQRNELLETIFGILYDEWQPIVIGDFMSQPIGGLLGSREFSPAGIRPKIGDKHVRVLSFYGVPSSTHPGILDAFLRDALPGCRFSARVIFQDSAAAEKRLQTMRKQWSGKKQTLTQSAGNKPPRRTNRTAARREEQVEQAIEIAGSERVAYVHFGAKIVVFADDEAEIIESVRSVRKAVQSRGFILLEETLNTIEAYVGQVPFDGHHDVRESQVNTINVAHIWPASSAWKGRTSWNCKNCGPKTVPALVGLTRTGEDFAMDPHSEDNQNFAALGFLGTGKTTTLNKMSAEYPRAPNDIAFGVDKNFGQFVTNQFLRGKYHDTGRFWLYGNLEDRRKRQYLARFLSNLLPLNDRVVEDQAIFMSTLEMMLDVPAPHRSLSTQLSLISPLDDSGDITTTLSDYAVGGIHDGVFDGTGDVLSGAAQHEVFELGAFLKGNASDKVAPPVLLWVLKSFEDRMPGHRSMVFVDEAWAAIKSPEVAREFEEFLRTSRFRHSGFGLFTQSIDEIKKSAIGAIVMGACQTKLLFPNPEANGTFRDFYERDNELTEAQINVIKNGKLKRDVVLKSAGHFGSFSLELSPAEVAIYGCTGADEVSAVRKLMIDYPDTWDERHLRERGCNREADRLRSLRRSHVGDPEMRREAISA